MKIVVGLELEIVVTDEEFRDLEELRKNGEITAFLEQTDLDTKGKLFLRAGLIDWKRAMKVGP